MSEHGDVLEMLQTGAEHVSVILNKSLNDAADSLEIGTPSKGGVVKIYGNFSDPEAFKKKIEQAKEVRLFAQQKFEL
jgi:hypothetical protein